MRTAAAMVVVASLLVACGGDDTSDADASADASTVTSDDGTAALTLPDGVDADGITVEPIEVEGAAAAYELLPSGTTFDEPATLTITDVPAPEGDPVAFAIVRSDDDDELELLDGVATTYTGDRSTTVSMPIAHFSRVSIVFTTNEGSALEVTAYTADFAPPAEATVNVPFDVPVRIAQVDARAELDIPYDTTEVLTIDRTLASGSITATNAAPAVAGNLPRRGELGAGYSGSASFSCRRPGAADLVYEVQYTFEVSQYRTFTISPASTFTVHGTRRDERTVDCLAGGPTTSRRPTTTTTEPAARPPTINRIVVELAVPVTTYTVDATSVGGARLDYEWRMAGESCGTPRTPWTDTQSGESVTWSHDNAPPDSCPHTSPDHDVEVSVTVTDSGASITCTIHGSASQVIEDPTCV